MLQTRRTATAIVLVAVAATAWLLTYEALSSSAASTTRNIALNPGDQHAHRLEIATARAAMDVLGMSGQDNPSAYRSDYRLQRIQMQADSLGLERWAAHDTRRQGLLLEIRASLAQLIASMDKATGNESTGGEATTDKMTGIGTTNPAAPNIPLLQALARAQTALTDYSASLMEPTRQAAQGPRYLFTMPFGLWWLLTLILVELAVLGWLLFARSRTGHERV